jgi:serine/threonine protein kinase
MEGSRLGPYLLGARLGTGGAASVYLGIRADPQNADPELAASASSPHEVVALKVIHEHLAVEREFVHMFLDEARVTSQLDHPNIVRTYELGRDGERLYMAMEYLHGQSLHEVFLRGTRHGSRLPVDLVAWIGARVAHALHYAHTLSDSSGNSLHLIHRDVSPRNIFISYDGTVKLIDFGIAHAVGRTAKTKVGQMKGTFSYIAPERALGGACDHRADIFSLATALFEAATGQRLFRGDDDVQTLRNVLSGRVPDPRTLRDGFPDEFARILLKALSLRPDARHLNALCLAEELDAFVAACGLEPPSARLSLMMRTIFQEQCEKKNLAIDEVRRVAAPDPSEVSHVAVRRQAGPLRRTIIAITAAAAVTAIALAAVLLPSRLFPVLDPVTAPQPPHPDTAATLPLPTVAAVPTTTTVSTTASIDVSTAPPVEATFQLGNQTARGSLARFRIPLGTEQVTMRVSAKGYEDALVHVLPDESRTIVIPLRERVDTVVSASPRQPTRTARSAARTKSEPPLNDLLNKRY